MTRRSLYSLALICSLLAVVLPVRARADDFHDQCIAPAVEVLLGRGAAQVGSAQVGFLRPQESRTHAFELPASGCYGFFVVGHRNVQDLDVMLHTAGGIALAQDVAVDAHPFVRFCGAERLDLRVSVRMFKGQGEYRLLVFRDAPAQLPDLNRAVGACFAEQEGVQQPGAEVGPEPRRNGEVDAISNATKELAELGYQPTGGEHSGVLPQGAARAERVILPGERCLAVLAVGAPTVADLDLLVRGPNGRVEARDVERERDALVKFCTDDGGPHVVEVRMYHGAGAFSVRLFELQEPRNRPKSVSGSARIGYAETLHRLRDLGMTVRPMGWGMLYPGEALFMTTKLVAGRCYAFGGVPTDELEGADLDLALVDELGNLLSWDLGRDALPLVYHCPKATGYFRVRGRLYGGRGRYLVLLGEDEVGGSP